MAQLQEIRMPDVGTDSVTVVKVLVKVGATVAAEEALFLLENDKASMEMPAPAAGVVKEIAVKPGEKVREGALLLVLEVAAAGIDLGKTDPTKV